MSSSELTPKADQKFIDKQMTSVIESIMTHGFSLANKGMIPSSQQLVVYISQTDEPTLLERIRKHPAAAATRALLADDQDLLRWASLVGRASNPS